MLPYNGTAWNTFPQKLNVRRCNAYMAQKDQHTVHIMGGTSSNPFLPCLKSEEVLDLRYPESGWQLKHLNVLEYYIVFQEKRSDY